MKTEFKIGQEVTCVNAEKLTGNEVGPPLEKDKKYWVKGITLDRDGNQHLDVGLKSEYAWITSFETNEKLPKGDEIHWCHPSRFI